MPGIGATRGEKPQHALFCVWPVHRGTARRAPGAGPRGGTESLRRQIGRARGRDIVQDREDETGAPVRCSFTDMTVDSCPWLAERSPDGGASWRLVGAFFARRVAA